MKEVHLVEAQAVNADLLHLTGPFWRRGIGEDVIDSDAGLPYRPSLAQAGSRPCQGTRAVRLPIPKKGPVRDVRRDQVRDPSLSLELTAQRVGEARRRVEPEIPV